MINLIDTKYEQTGASISSNHLGMREMQSRAYAKYEQQYILLKAPPASGKSRALMFIALEKLKQGLVKKVIVAVPEKSIGKSFAETDLTSNGFHSDWKPNPRYDLCTPGSNEALTNIFVRFMQDESDEAKILICTHSTLRFAYAKIQRESFNDCLIAIDEFHHVSADTDNILGNLLRDIINNTSAHVLAMTGSYFRGDCTAVLSPVDELKFREGRVTYNYYEQLNGYKYLKSLGIGFHFYQGSYLNSIKDVLNLDEKTIIYIPNVNSSESTKEKYYEVDQLIDIIGTLDYIDESNIYHINGRNGKHLKVADLVNENGRDKVMGYLRTVEKIDDIDIIIALGMAKEGFDWKFCQTTLTVGYRGSLTEIVQIIGRCTRDSNNKEHAQFTNLISEPDAERSEVAQCVNDILKAISASLLMEEVVAPRFNFTPKTNEDGSATDVPNINISGFRPITSPAVKDIINNDLVDLKARIYQDPTVQSAMVGAVPPETLTKHLIPKVIEETYSDLTSDEIKQLSDYVVVDTFLNAVRGTGTPTTSNPDEEDKINDKIIKFASKLINVADLNMDLIYSINPFNQAYEILSKQLDAKVFKAIQNTIQAMRVDITEEEAIELWPKINQFFAAFKRKPSLDSIDAYERRLAEALVLLNKINQSSKV